MQGRDTDNPLQQERVRQDYLEAMGIQTWYPRCQLPNALPPRPFDWIEEDAAVWQQQQTQSDPEPVPSQTSSTPASVYSRPSAADILGQAAISDNVPASEAVKKPQPVSIKPKSLRGTPATSKFRLIIQSVSDQCLVVAEMPYSGLNQFTRFHQHLLNDMLLALNIPQSNAPPTTGEFVWPMEEKRGLMGQINQDDNSAAEAVCAFLSNQYGLARRQTVLLLGQAAARFVSDPEKPFEELRGVQQGIHSQQFFVSSHGLNELMKLPHLKAEAWQDLAPLLRISSENKTQTESATE